MIRLRVTVQHHCIHLLQPGNRLTQRTGWQAKSITELSHRIYDANLIRTGQPEVLQPIITEHNSGIRMLPDEPERCGPIRVNNYGTTGVTINQGGLVTGIGDRNRVIDQKRITLRLTLIAPADDRGPETFFFQMMSEGNDEGCLPRSTCREVSDHDDGTA